MLMWCSTLMVMAPPCGFALDAILPQPGACVIIRLQHCSPRGRASGAAASLSGADMEDNKRRSFLKIIPIVAAGAALGAHGGLSLAQAKKDEKSKGKGDAKSDEKAAKGGELPHV